MSVRRKKKRSSFSVKRWKGHRYQNRCVSLGMDKPHFAFFLDPGLGKTTIILQILKMLLLSGDVKAMLVVAPLRPCYMVWPKEVKKWANFCHLSVGILHGNNKVKVLGEKHDIYVINPEGLPWLITQLKGHKKKDWPFNMLTVDESTKFKNLTSGRTKNIKKMLAGFDRRYILTGTPTPNGLLNIQSQIMICDGGKALGTTKTGYHEKYFRPVGKPEWRQFELQSKKSADEIYECIAHLCVRLSADKNLKGLPKKIDNLIEIDLPPKARKIYKQLEKELFTELENGEAITALSASAKRIKCVQLANGCVYEDIDPTEDVAPKDRKVFKIHEAKLDALQDLCEELDGKPILIAYWFKHDLDALKKRFGSKLKVLGSNMAECVQIEKDWNAGKIEMLAAQPSSAALGLNLQDCGSDIFWYSMIDDWEAYDQYIKRILRQGNKNKSVRNHVCIAKGTLDQYMYNRLQEKEGEQVNFFNGVLGFLNKLLVK